MPTKYLGTADAETRKILGQLAPTAATLSTLYTSTGASVITGLTVANRGTVTDHFRVALRPGGEAVADKHYVYYDIPVGGGDAFLADLSMGLPLADDDIVSVYSLLGTLSFGAYGYEIA